MQVGVHPQAAPLTPLQRQQQPVNLARDIYGQGSVGKEGFLWVTVWRGSVSGGGSTSASSNARRRHSTALWRSWPGHRRRRPQCQSRRNGIESVVYTQLHSRVLFYKTSLSVCTHTLMLGTLPRRHCPGSRRRRSACGTQPWRSGVLGRHCVSPRRDRGALVS